MLSPTPAKYRKRGRAKPQRVPPAVSTGPILIATFYNTSNLSLNLTFDRPIDIASLDGTKIMLVDGIINSIAFDMTGGAELVSPTEVMFNLFGVDNYELPHMWLSSVQGNGIKSLDGVEWAGVTDYTVQY